MSLGVAIFKSFKQLIYSELLSNLCLNLMPDWIDYSATLFLQGQLSLWIMQPLYAPSNMMYLCPSIVIEYIFVPIDRLKYISFDWTDAESTFTPHPAKYKTDAMTIV